MALPQQRRNHATHPSFETASGTVNVRTNYFTNPQFETNTTGVATNYGTTGAGTLSRPTTGGFNTGHVRMQWTTASTAIGGYIQNALGTLDQTGTHTLSVYARVNAAQRLQLSVSPGGTAAATVTSNPAVDLVANVWTRITATVNVTTAGTGLVVRLSAVAGGSGRVWAVGNQLDLDCCLFEYGPTLGAYFDGGTAAVSEFTQAWSGTAHASISHQQAPGVAGYQSYWGAKDWAVYQTGLVYLGGTKAMRCQARAPQTFLHGTTLNSTAVTEGDPITASYYVRPSVTRNFQAKISWDAAQPNLDGPLTSCPANTWTRVSVIGTVPPGATLATLYFNTEVISAAGDIYDIDHVLIEEASTLGTYFDGSTEEGGSSNLWTGTAHASASTQDATGLWVDVDLTGTAHTQLTVLGLGNTQAVTKIVRSDGKTTFPVPGWLRRLTIDADTGTDWTPPLGKPITYTLYKDGIPVASRTVTVEADTGDIMDPLNPQGALKIRTTGGDPTALALGQQSVAQVRHENISNDREYPLGGRYAISRPGVRAAAQQIPFVLNAHTNEVSDNLQSIVEQAPIVLIRPHPSWGALPTLIYTDAPIEEAPFNRGRGGEFTQWTLEADAVAPVTRTVTAGRITNQEVKDNLAGRTHDSIKTASGHKRHVEIKANPLSLGQ